MKILLVEDDPKFASDLKTWLEREDYVVDTVTTGDEASPHSVRVCITRLRSKLFDENSRVSIRTIYGAGYVLE